MLRFRHALTSTASKLICHMPDDPPPAPGGGNPPPPQPPAPQPPAPAPQPPAPAPAPARQAIDPTLPAEQRVTLLEREVADVRAEAAVNRIGRREANERIEALTGEIATTRTEIDTRVAATRQEYEPRITALTTRTIDAELRAAAIQGGLVDADLVPLIDKAGITMSPDGQTITGIPEAIARFKASKPNYFQEVRVQQPAPPPARTLGSPHTPPAPQPGGPSPTNVRTLDAGAYKDAKKSAISGLRG